MDFYVSEIRLIYLWDFLLYSLHLMLNKQIKSTSVNHKKGLNVQSDDVCLFSYLGKLKLNFS